MSRKNEFAASAFAILTRRPKPSANSRASKKPSEDLKFSLSPYLFTLKTAV